MPDKKVYYLAFVLLSLILFCTVPVLALTAPYSFSVSPVSAEGKPGDTVTYHITITANSGFNSPVDFTMDVGTLGYSQKIVLGTYQGPYPQSFTYILTIPQEVPTGITADVTVNGKSGTYLQQQNLKLKVTGNGGPIESVTSAITDLINTIMREIASITGSKGSGSDEVLLLIFPFYCARKGSADCSSRSRFHNYHVAGGIDLNLRKTGTKTYIIGDFPLLLSF